MFDKLKIYRAIDKHDRLGPEGVRELLTTGRTDPSGHFTEGAGLSEYKADLILNLISIGKQGETNEEILKKIYRWFWIISMSETELNELYSVLEKAGLIEKTPE